MLKRFLLASAAVVALSLGFSVHSAATPPATRAATPASAAYRTVWAKIRAVPHPAKADFLADIELLGFRRPGTDDNVREYRADDGMVRVLALDSLMNANYFPTTRGRPCPALLDVLAAKASSVSVSGADGLVFSFRDVEGGADAITLSLADGAWIATGTGYHWE